MAKVSELFPHSFEEEEESYQSEIDFDAETLDHAPYWSSVFEEETLVPPTPPIFSPETSLQRSDYEDQITLSLDLFERCPPLETLDTSDFRVFDGIESMASDYLGLGLGLGFDIQEQEQEEEDHSMDQGDGLRIVGFESDSDSESDPNSNNQDPNLPPLCWDSLRLEEDRRDLDEDFEWEEVDGRLDERDFLSMMVGERSRSSELGEDEADEEGEEARNVDWEVLIHVSNVVVEDGEVVVDGDFINPLEYEVLFEQFADHESAIRGTPPAAKSAVNNLPSVVLTQDDVAKNNAICAVCKDEIALEEKVKQLPCLHHYHGDCILPWLGMRNTCPVCRYELPTDDPDYESWKAQRRASMEGRYDLEMFSEPLM